MPAMTARDANLIACDACGKLCTVASGAAAAYCPRCHSRLHSRIDRGLQRSWALVLAGAILLVPANTYPILTVIYFGSGSPDTIMSGVVDLWQQGLWGIATIVFVASVFVPIFKLVVIALLLMVVQLRVPLTTMQCTLLYRFIRLIGRWSMLDLFMISILVTMVDLGNIARVESGPAATAFAAVVVLTLLAADTMDSRLIWDLRNDRRA